MGERLRQAYQVMCLREGTRYLYTANEPNDISPAWTVEEHMTQDPDDGTTSRVSGREVQATEQLLGGS